MSFIDTVPIDKDAAFESNWTTYIGCVVAACAADGLSASEKSAIADWAAAQGVPAGVIDKAVAAARGMDLAAVSSNKSAAFFGPYLVRDAIRMCKIDGLGDAEKAAITRLAQAVGVNAAQQSAIQAVVDQHDAALAGWKKLVAS
ncbi:MAG: hypothetical protein RI884_1086 [Pseudomonadota bacterium]|jgi:tellurite resistance protein